MAKQEHLDILKQGHYNHALILFHFNTNQAGVPKNPSFLLLNEHRRIFSNRSQFSQNLSSKLRNVGSIELA